MHFCVYSFHHLKGVIGVTLQLKASIHAALQGGTWFYKLAHGPPRATSKKPSVQEVLGK